MYRITLDGVPMWSVNGINYATREEAEKAEQEIAADYAKGGRYYGD